MFYRDDHRTFIWPKGLIAAALVLSILASGDILFGDRIGLTIRDNPYCTNGDRFRDGILAVCFVVLLLRYVATLFIFIRRIFYWREALIVANIMPWCIIYIAYFCGKQTGPIGLAEAIGVFLFILGSYFNSAREYSRYKWKQLPSNKGHLYAEGLFTHVRHINYTGDIMLFSGLALVANELALLLIPLGMALVFLLVLIPLKENYRRNKYGREFVEYASTTKMLIPMVI